MAPCSGPSRIALWLGDLTLYSDFSITPVSGGQSFRVEADVICHPEFDGKCSHGSDVVLLKLASPLPSWVKPVPLHLDSSKKDVVGADVLSIGYGITEDPQDPTMIEGINAKHLHEVKLSILEDESAQCSNVYAGGYGCSDDSSEGPVLNQEQQVCAGATNLPERDTCSGDSGSPLLSTDGVQIGIVSYGGGPGERMSGPGRICADPEYPGIYARISAFKEYIEEYVTDLPRE